MSSSEHGSPAHFEWADFDGDEKLDLAAVSPDGRLQLLANDGEGRFEDETERVGLGGIANAALARWADYDGDRRLDLFVGAREGASRLFHNEGGLFVEVSTESGLLLEGAVQSAHWLDHDGDGRLDLHAVTAAKNQVFRGLPSGVFEASEIPGPAADPERPSESWPGSSASDVSPTSAPKGDRDAEPVGKEGPSGRSARTAELPRMDDRRPSGLPDPVTVDPPTLLGFPLACASSLRDQASPASCLEASTIPTLGRLYPISANLFVAVGGEVGIGTTAPTARLHVAGTARVTDTLTLAPAGDVALDVAAGSIYKGGALFAHTKGGAQNTALGRVALSNVTTGDYNTALGEGALFSNTDGFRNTAAGSSALSGNTSGVFNTATGSAALRDNTIGSYNTACGSSALLSNTTGSNNAASGAGALLSNTTGDHNTAGGFGALLFNTSGFRNTAFGYRALAANKTGFANTACGTLALRKSNSSYNSAHGAYALYSDTVGGDNTAMGSKALWSNTSGAGNTACGKGALFYNTTGSDNTALGRNALAYNTTGSRNIVLGRNSGNYLTTGNDNIAIGNLGFPGYSGTIWIGTSVTHTRAFISGIRGVTTAFANAVPVVIDSSGQLGTVSSSRRFKEEIRDMGELSERLLALRPVVFRYKPEVQAGERPLEYGLIAEEVAEVFPELVVYDDEGEPLTVKYHLLSSMLLNELQRTRDAHARELEELRARLTALEARFPPAEGTARLVGPTR